MKQIRRYYNTTIAHLHSELRWQLSKIDCLTISDEQKEFLRVESKQSYNRTTQLIRGH